MVHPYAEIKFPLWKVNAVDNSAILGFSPQNIITVCIMGAIGFTAYAWAAKSYSDWKAKGQ